MGNIIKPLIIGITMLIVTVLIQFVLYKKKIGGGFWSGLELVFVVSIIGIISGDPDYFACILGYVVGDYIGAFAGWHVSTK